MVCHNGFHLRRRKRSNVLLFAIVGSRWRYSIILTNIVFSSARRGETLQPGFAFISGTAIAGGGTLVRWRVDERVFIDGLDDDRDWIVDIVKRMYLDLASQGGVPVRGSAY
jgi:hypothetical protein